MIEFSKMMLACTPGCDDYSLLVCEVSVHCDVVFYFGHCVEWGPIHQQ